LQPLLSAFLVLNQAVAKDFLGLLLAATAAQHIDGTVVGDLVEPDAEGFWGAQLGQAAKQDQPDVLKDVEGRFAVDHEAEDEVEQAAVVKVDELAKGVNVAAAGAQHPLSFRVPAIGLRRRHAAGP